MTKLGTTGLDVFGVCLGGNVFGWTADADTSRAVLDAYHAGGGNFIDTADSYSVWADGNEGGESERLIGDWIHRRGVRGEVVIATKVGQQPGLTGLKPETIRAACDASLRRLGVDTIDLYYAHEDDPSTPIAETLAAFDALVRAGKVRYVAASNYTAARLAEALVVADRDATTRYAALQPHYNLMHRDEYEGDLEAVCAANGVACLPYYALASGFLTGKYRASHSAPGASVRAEGAIRYLTERGVRVLSLIHI